MQENLDLFNDLNADIYAISTDSPENSKSLKEAGAFTFSFLSDQTSEVLEHVSMKNNGMSYRGMSILDKNGNHIYNQINDHWGEQIEDMIVLIHEHLENE